MSGHPGEHPEVKPGSLSWDEGDVKVRMRGWGGWGVRRKNETMQLGRELCGKLPTKAQENWGRPGQVLWDTHRPSEGEASLLLI